MATIIELFRIPKELTVEFLGTFARFGYSLKRAGYVKGDEKHAWADWYRFGHELASLDPVVLAPVLKCCQYLRDHPPKKQVMRGGQLEWAVRTEAQSAIEEVLLSTRTVRNKVFHGGKFPQELVAEPLRDEQLIRDCLAALKAILDLPGLPKKVTSYFRSET